MKKIAMSVVSAVGMVLMVYSSAYANTFPPPAQVPEPGTMLLLGAGVAGLAVTKFVRKHRK